MSNFCSLKVNATHLFISGGEPSSNRAHLLDLTTGAWTRLADFHYARSDHGCGLARDPARILIVGGNTRVAEEDNRSEVFNLQRGEWEVGPEIPGLYALSGSVSVPYGDTFLLVGGYETTVLDKIFQYDPVNNEFFEREERLAVARGSHAVIPFPIGLLP